MVIRKLAGGEEFQTFINLLLLVGLGNGFNKLENRLFKKEWIEIGDCKPISLTFVEKINNPGAECDNGGIKKQQA